MMSFSFSQNVSSGTSLNSVLYEQIVYQEYQQGIVVNADGVVEGVLLRNINGVGEPIPHVKLTIIGGDDFVVTVETDENGEFSFEGADVGSYTVVFDENATLSSLDFKVTAYHPEKQSFGPNTGMNEKLILVVDENNNLRFAATQGKTGFIPPANVAQVPAASAAGGLSAASGAAGNFGALAGALGIGGLAAGIVALATADNGGSKPVSTGTP